MNNYFILFYKKNDLDTEQTSYFNYGSNDDVYGDYY